MTIRSYHELRALKTFSDRLTYLRIHGSVGSETFGYDRVFNQQFYRSKEWRDIRKYVIARDMGCDLGIEGKEIFGTVLIHHMNPISLSDIENATDILLNPEYLICVSHETHNAIHYGLDIKEQELPMERTPGDTCPWKRGTL